MPGPFAQRILAHLAHQAYRPSSVEIIESQMQVAREQRAAFEADIEALADDERLEITEDGRIQLPSYGDEATGYIKVNPRGFAFVRPDDPTREGDLYIPRGDTSDAVSGDRVRCRVLRRGMGRSRGRGAAEQARRGVVGRVVDIIERKQTRFAGRLQKRGRNWFVQPDGRALQQPVLIRDPHAKNAKPDDKVVIDMVLFPDEHGIGEAVIVEVLGSAGEPDVETRAVIETYGLRTDFPEATVNEARSSANRFDRESEEDTTDREDLTDRFIFTIDPPDARDFDDAISIAYDPERGEWELGVHIADVAHFVTQDGELDREASERGNSTYLPQQVLPMLPEVLSNGVCSLQEGVTRFTKSAFMHFDDKGRVIDQRLARTVIRSRKRLTYLEAQSLIDGNSKEARKHSRTEPVYDEELLDALRMANRLAGIIRKRRLRDGMLVLNLPEFELVFDDEGRVTDAVPEDDAFTHTLIEMFMVEANEAVARIFANLELPLLRRIHPEPSFHDVAELREFAQVIGYMLPEEPDRHDIKTLLDMTRDSPAARAVHFSLLRTFTKATYSPALIGHFALASGHYAHFTSPIRRYPDLTVHRAIDAFLDHSDNGRNIPGGRGRRQFTDLLHGDSRVLDEGRLVDIGRHCSETEVNSESAERDLRTFLVMQFMHEHHLGSEFPGVVTHTSANGNVFVSIDRFLVEGVARASEAVGADGREDRWGEHGAARRLVAERSGASIGLGDSVVVKVIRVDPAGRQMELAIVEFIQQVPKIETQRGDGRGRGRHTGPINRKKGGREGRGKGKKGKGGGRRGRNR
ncbi:MAG: VacB/RNase II family 3'-5' exoribonuclease [Phycisphaerales bacterium]|nr:VacB/RNase II family 3'-5' exoribonuclease [Phycisphaerales bacterium]